MSASPDATFSTPNSTPSQDSIPPSVPTTLTTSNITSTNVTLTWSASTDNVSVAGYNIYRNGASIATSTTSLYSDSNLTPSTTYSYAVSAYDSAGNTSALTSLVRATTQKGGTPGNYTLGWNELFSTKLKDVCPPDGQKDWNGNKYLFSYACRNVITAWSSGIFDSLRNRFILWGGGHGDYFGNELYAVNLGQIPPNLVRLNDPSPINTDLNDCKETLSDGNPNSRHTYGGLVYIQHADRMFTY